jgi:NAD-dependent histone deacetylase SIR2
MLLVLRFLFQVKQDFRSSDGLYALVKQQYPDIVLKGRDLFDASLFRDSTSTAVFYTFISQLKQSIDSASPTPTHHFIKTLDIKKKLLRSYTQNIDGLEAKAGLLGTSSQEAKTNGKGKYKINTKVARNVQLHGDIHRVRCMSCSAEYSCTKEHLRIFAEGMPPDCPECLARCECPFLFFIAASTLIHIPTSSSSCSPFCSAY